MNDKIKHLLENAEKSDAIARNKWRIENREQLREERKQKLKELMEKDKQQTEAKQKQRWIDVYLGRYKWYRKIVGGIWYKHKFTRDGQEICVTFIGTWWARYAELNRYSKVVEVETYGGGNK